MEAVSEEGGRGKSRAPMNRMEEAGKPQHARCSPGEMQGVVKAAIGLGNRKRPTQSQVTIQVKSRLREEDENELGGILMKSKVKEAHTTSAAGGQKSWNQSTSDENIPETGVRMEGEMPGAKPMGASQAQNRTTIAHLTRSR